jgi:hypothetical protein
MGSIFLYTAVLVCPANDGSAGLHDARTLEKLNAYENCDYTKPDDRLIAASGFFLRFVQAAS